jgi:uracil-DNA glycosylase family 4
LKDNGRMRQTPSDDNAIISDLPFHLSQQQAAWETCQKCPRLIQWCTQVAQTKVKRFDSEAYWGKPVPSFTACSQDSSPDLSVKLLIVGLAPAVHGANRTGRMFTGDRSGDWLYRALFKAGFASQPNAMSKDDGLKLFHTWITAVAHCAPPDNKPTPEEIQTCRPYLQNELNGLQQVQVIVALGGIAFNAVLEETGPWKALKNKALKNKALKNKASQDGLSKNAPKPKFGHGAEVVLEAGRMGKQHDTLLIGSYHPSQQNTFTGRLTESMLDAIFERANAFMSNQSL